MARAAFSGGDGLRSRLREIRERLTKKDELSVGFFEDATYPDGTPVAYIASIQEFGGTINVAAHEVSIFRKLLQNGEFSRGGKFVKRKDANVETRHMVPAHTITIPPRPFFRTMIAKNKDGWGETLGTFLAENNYDITLSFKALGVVMEGQLKDSISGWTSPPNAKSTIAGKGFNKPLVDTGVMLRSPSFRVGTDE